MDDGPRAIRSLAAASAEPPHASSSDDAAASTFSAHAPTPPKIALCGHTLCGRPVVFEARVRARPAHAAAPASRQQAAPMPTGFYQMLRSAEAHAAAAQTRRQERDRPPIVSAPETRLWVEKYQPKKFTELLAVDQSNVQILRWACQWRDLIAGAGAKTSGPDAPPGGAQPLPKPDRKILLLAGPPGLGKTTLAHVIADAAGFQAVEINASDERSGDAVLGKLKAAITSDSMLPGHKPNLVIIDEIDGALGAAHSDKSLISYLAQLAATPAAHRSSAEADEKRPKTGGTRAQPALRRPIVCICNDLYAPALKPLRTAALVLVLPLRKPNAALLAARLRRICEEERVRIDGKALLELVDLMDCDMRASLHALHFIARSPTLPQSGLLTANNIGRALSGFRDVGRSTGSVYESIFHAAPRASKTADSTLLAHITGHGEYDRLAVGVFELYLQTKFYDDTRLGKVNAALASLAFSDLCSAPVGEERLSAYQPYALLQVHRSFASPVPTSLPFPRADYHRSQQLADNLRVLQSYARGLPPAVQAAAALAELAMERIPALLAVIEPRLRVANPQLLRGEERARVGRLVQLMIAEGISYRAATPADGADAVLGLDPPLHTLADLSGNAHGAPRAARQEDGHQDAVRQMIASEIEGEKIRLAQQRRPVQETSRGRGRSADLAEAYAGFLSAARPVPKPAPPPATKRDFFGRPIEPPPASKTGDTAGVPPQKLDPAAPRIWFRFNEGYTNAVRRTIKIKDLFPGKRAS